MKYLLIRHGESIQNTFENREMKLPDSKVYLTEKGLLQAKMTGVYLKEFLENNNIRKEQVNLYISPYIRTMQTANEINKIINIENCYKDIAIVEHDFGLFSDNTKEENKLKYPNEYELYNRFRQNGSGFYARFPLGESPFDVYIRTRLFYERLKREGNEYNIVVAHGNSLKCLLMNIMGYDEKWFEEEYNLDNCSVRYVDDELKIDKYIYKGEVRRK